MLLDSQSNLWCGTENGLFGFNGTSCTHYDTTNGLAHNYINALTWDSTSQDLWIGTIQGLNVLDKNLTLIKPQISELPSNFISAIQYFDTGTILIGTPLGLSKFEKNSIKTYTTSDKLLDNYIQTIHVDKEKRILAGTRMSVSIFDSSVWTNPFVKINNKNILSINTQIETTWIGTWSGVSLYFNTTFETTYYPDKKINYIYKDTDQSMWFASSDGTINFKDNQWINYTFIEEFGDGKINSIEKNKNGIWVTQKDKIAEYKNPNWKFYNLQNTEINNMTFDSLNLPIVATTSGVFKLNNSNDWQQLDTTKGLKVNKLKYIDKNLWIAHDKGVSFIDSTGLFFDTSIIPAYLIAYNNKYQEIWCGSANGVNILNSIGTWTNYDSNKNVIGSKINDIIFDTSFNTTWIATDKGISEFYNSSGIWAWLNNYVLGNASPVYSIEFTSDGHLWACTPIGLGEYYNNAWTIYDTTFNLPTNKINDIYTNSSGEKWISTDKGVTKWSGAEKKLFLPIK